MQNIDVKKTSPLTTHRPEGKVAERHSVLTSPCSWGKNLSYCVINHFCV